MLKRLCKNRIAYVFLAPAVLVMLSIVFYPLLLGIIYSFTNMDQYNMGNIANPPSWEWIGLKNYSSLFQDANSEFWMVTVTTVIWTAANVFFHFTIGLLLAVLLNRKIKGRTVYRMLMLVPWAVPSFVAAFSWRWMFNTDFGIINLTLAAWGFDPIPWLSQKWTALFAVILTNIWLGIPFMMVTILGGLQSIPKELYEAAEVDGATVWERFRHITLPMLRPVSLSIILLGIIWTFNQFSVIYLVTQGAPYRQTDILVTYAYQEAFTNWNLGMASTYGVIILSFLIAFSTFYARLTQRQEVR